MYEVHCLKPLLISVKNSKLCEKLWFLTKSPKHSKASFFLYYQEGLATMFHKI